MVGTIELSHLFVQANVALVDTLLKALQGVGHRFLGRHESPSDSKIDEWLSDFDVFVRQCGVPEDERAVVLVDYLGGCAKQEVLYVTRMRFVGTSGPWCLCCGECLARGRT